MTYIIPFPITPEPILEMKKALRPGYQCVQDARQWQVMARCIQQYAPVRKAGKIFNLRLVDKELHGSNIKCFRIQRELITVTEELEGLSQDPQKSMCECSPKQLSCPSHQPPCIKTHNCPMPTKHKHSMNYSVYILDLPQASRFIVFKAM